MEKRAIAVTSNRVGHAQVLLNLLSQIPTVENAATVSGDGIYDTNCSHAACAERDAGAIIHVRKNGKMWKENTPRAVARNDALRATQRLGQAIWKKWISDHRRRWVETKMRGFKLLDKVSGHATFVARLQKLRFALRC